MTREEAIKTLKGEAWISCSEKWNEALELAIKALENPERNVIAVMPCGNCIDRQAAIDELKRISFSYWFECGDYISEDTREIEIINSDKALEVIEALPSVTPAEKVGPCKDCKYFEYDSVAKVDGIPLIVAHEICSKWGNGCKTKEDGYCFLFEPK